MKSLFRIRYGIATVMLLTGLVAVLLRGYTSTIQITFDDLKLEPSATVKNSEVIFPPRIHLLAERRVRIRGYILAASVFQAKDIRQFILCRDHFENVPKYCEYIVVRLDSSESIDFTTRPIGITGTLKLHQPKTENWNLNIYYELTDASVDEKKL